MRAQALLGLSIGYQINGDLAQAYASLFDSGEPDQGRSFRMRLLVNACLIHWTAADLPGVAQAAKQILEASDPSGSQVETTTWARFHLGIFHYERNDLAAAAGYLTHLALQPYQPHLLGFLHSAAALALIHQAQGQPAQAYEIAERMMSLALETGSSGALELAKGFRAELALRQGRLAEASQWAEQYPGPLAVPQLFFYHRPLTLVRILVAQNTPASRQRAGQVLATLHAYFTSIYYTFVRIEVLALQALLHQSEGNERGALDALAQALDLAEPGGIIRLFVDLASRWSDC